MPKQKRTKKLDSSLEFGDIFEGLQAVLRRFLRDEAIGGKLLVAGAVIALVLFNTPWQAAYAHFWEAPVRIGFGDFGLQLDIRHWINEGLMTIFFLVVGFEIKKEIVYGALKHPKVAILPVGAAIGGMLVPALVYMAFNTGRDTFSGWGIPMATDIAFAVAVLSLMGRRVPAIVKLLLLTLAIVDDIGAILVIALFYAHDTHPLLLAGAGALIIAIALSRHRIGKSMLAFLGAGVALWLLLHLGGVHASIAGAVLGLLAPVRRGHGLTAQLEHVALPLSTFIVMPLFALANAGTPISTSILQENMAVFLGIVTGLVVGKAGGIVLAAWLLVRVGAAKLPHGLRWQHITGMGFLAGIGFTVSIFIAGLAFTVPAYENAAKLSILIGSVASALIGTAVLLRVPRRTLP